jgi:hypothetical protein
MLMLLFFLSVLCASVCSVLVFCPGAIEHEPLLIEPQ